MANDVTVDGRMDTHRAGLIAIGIFVICLIVFGQFMGVVPVLLSSVMPEPPAGKVSGVYDLFTESLSSFLALVGALAVAMFSTLGQLIVQIIAWVIAKVSTPSAKAVDATGTADLKSLVDVRISQTLAAINQHVAMKPDLASLEDRIASIEKALSTMTAGR